MNKKIADIFKTENRIFGLDLLRFVAIVLVVMGHSRWIIDGTFPKPLKAILHGSGILGVELFFVLSGYLIGGILLKQFQKNNFSLNFQGIKTFWIRRWLRTLPNYYLILLVYFIVFYMQKPDSMWRYLFFLQNIWNHPPYFFEESWSLCIEEISYLISPLILAFSAFIFGKNGKGKDTYFLFTSIGLIVFVTILRLIYSAYFIPNHISEPDFKWSYQFREVALIRLDSIYYGFIAAYIAYKNKEFWVKNKLLFFVIGLLGIIALMTFQKTITDSNTFFFTFLSISITFIIPYLSEYKTAKFSFIAKPITAVSIISYSLYLINGGLIAENLKRFSNAGEGWNFAQALGVYLFYWFICLTLSTLIFVFFEKPMTDLRNKFK
ncbi:MAG: acyltransferase [Bacteroidia bacterium]|nr:acyltransferase [Bacteroidia bacterium]